MALINTLMGSSLKSIIIINFGGSGVGGGEGIGKE